MEEETNEEKRSRLSLERIKTILEQKKLSKLDGKKLAIWYLKETGINEQSCMCNRRQISDIRNSVETYLKLKEEEETDDK